MEIKTKLNVGDTCYYLHENKVVSNNIVGIEIKVKNKVFNTHDVGVEFVDIKYIVPDSDRHLIEENLVFPNKQELLNSL